MSVYNSKTHKLVFNKDARTITDFVAWMNQGEFIWGLDVVMSSLHEAGIYNTVISDTAPTDIKKIWIKPGTTPEDEACDVLAWNRKKGQWEKANFELISDSLSLSLSEPWRAENIVSSGQDGLNLVKLAQDIVNNPSAIQILKLAIDTDTWSNLEQINNNQYKYTNVDGEEIIIDIGSGRKIAIYTESFGEEITASPQTPVGVKMGNNRYGEIQNDVTYFDVDGDIVLPEGNWKVEMTVDAPSTAWSKLQEASHLEIPSIDLRFDTYSKIISGVGTPAEFEVVFDGIGIDSGKDYGNIGGGYNAASLDGIYTFETPRSSVTEVVENRYDEATNQVIRTVYPTPNIGNYFSGSQTALSYFNGSLYVYVRTERDVSGEIIKLDYKNDTFEVVQRYNFPNAGRAYSFGGLVIVSDTVAYHRIQYFLTRIDNWQANNWTATLIEPASTTLKNNEVGNYGQLLYANEKIYVSDTFGANGAILYELKRNTGALTEVARTPEEDRNVTLTQVVITYGRPADDKNVSGSSFKLISIPIGETRKLSVRYQQDTLDTHTLSPIGVRLLATKI